MAIFGKALGNGHPISAVIGKRKIMDFAQKTFISSTMWTESIGFIAGITALNKMKKLNVQKNLVKYGKKIKIGWAKVARKNGIKISINGLNSLPVFRFEYHQPNFIEQHTAYEDCKIESQILDKVLARKKKLRIVKNPKDFESFWSFNSRLEVAT